MFHYQQTKQNKTKQNKKKILDGREYELMDKTKMIDSEIL
jgi:hypothetical protein